MLMIFFKIIDNKKCLNYNYNYIKQKNIGG